MTTPAIFNPLVFNDLVFHADTQVSAAGFRVSLVNLAAGALVTASSEAAGYPASNGVSPGRPFQPWRSGTAGEEWLLVDFGAPTTLDVVAVIRANVTALTIQGHTTDDWDAPLYTQDVTLARNPISSRYHHAHEIAGSYNCHHQV